jgi:hypothetical protein
MKLEITDIWIESEEKGVITKGTPEFDDNSDVIVTMKSGKRFIATFYTYQNIKSLKKKNFDSGECLSGKYFWASDMILIDVLNRAEIETVVLHLLQMEQFRSIFRLIE